MMDKLIVFNQPRIRETVETTIHEHRAPTDESIKIYKDMVEKAEKSVLDRFELRDNFLNCSMAILEKVDNMSKRVVYKVVLNGKIIEGTLDIELNHLMLGRDEVIKMVYEKISKEITQQLFESITQESVSLNV